MTPDLCERLARLKDFVLSRNKPGQCKVLSQGDLCKCPLCDFDAVAEALKDCQKAIDMITSMEADKS